MPARCVKSLGVVRAGPGGSAVVIDVREPVEYVAGHVPGAVLIPMGQLT